MKSSKVAVIGNGNGFGGAQTAFREFGKYLDNRTCDWSAISIGQPPMGFPTPSARLITLPHSSRTAISACSKLMGLVRSIVHVRRFKPEVLVSIGLNTTAAVIFQSCPKQTFRCAIDFIHDRSMQDQMLLRVARHSDCIATQTQSMMKRFAAAGGAFKNLTWLPCFSEAKVPGLLKAKKCDSVIRLCYFGRIAKNKGIDLAIHAIKNLPSDLDVRLDLWGKGEVEQYVELVRSLGLEKVVCFRGEYKSGVELANLMVGYDGLILTSTGMEGLPLVPLEAMSYGLPLLVTDVGSMAEIAKDNPDVILAEPTRESVSQALVRFVCGIAHNQFEPTRQAAYYENTFGYEVMSRRWDAFLSCPYSFVESDGGLAQHRN